MNLLTKEDCIASGKHLTKVFTSAFPYKHFCKYCMSEIVELE